MHKIIYLLHLRIQVFPLNPRSSTKNHIHFIEIIFVVVPIVGPILIALGFDPLWLGVMIGVNLQTSFLTPPFGFALFYLRGVAPNTVNCIRV